jgi:hypothetical protein
MDLIEELMKPIPNNERILDLITDENLKYVDSNGECPLMIAFISYGSKPECVSSVFFKMLEHKCYPDHVGGFNLTSLMCAFRYYGSYPHCDPEVLLKLLSMNCRPEYIDRNNFTALMYALKYYGSYPHCNSEVLLKLLSLTCLPEQVNGDDYTALMCAFRYYGAEQHSDPEVLLKLLSMNCRPEYINRNNFTALMLAFRFYSYKPYCDSEVLLKLLSLGCKPLHKKIDSDRKYYFGGRYIPAYFSALKLAFNYGMLQHCDFQVIHKLLDVCILEGKKDVEPKFNIIKRALECYDKNPECGGSIFLKLYILKHPNINKKTLTDILSAYSEKYQELKTEIVREFNYKFRDIIVRHRANKRILNGTYHY